MEIIGKGDRRVKGGGDKSLHPTTIGVKGGKGGAKREACYGTA